MRYYSLILFIEHQTIYPVKISTRNWTDLMKQAEMTTRKKWSRYSLKQKDSRRTGQERRLKRFKKKNIKLAMFQVSSYTEVSTLKQNLPGSPSLRRRKLTKRVSISTWEKLYINITSMFISIFGHRFNYEFQLSRCIVDWSLQVSTRKV